MMMIMFLIMVIGVGVVILLGFFALNMSTEIKRKRQEEDFGDDVVEKAKRGRVRLSDDGELVDISDTDSQADEQWKQSY
jgi:hypothetical protein